MQWRQCVEWPDFEVSEYGDVRRLVATQLNSVGALVRQHRKPSGYLFVHGYSPRTQKCTNFYVHRLVARAFLGAAPSDKHEIAHNDGCPSHNHYSNLRWATRLENCRDKNVHDSHPKLKRADLAKIREKFATGAATRTALAREFGITCTHVTRVVTHQTWA